MNVKPTAIDLFAGAGGFGLGLKMSGFDVLLSLERDSWACETLRNNDASMKVIEGDITSFNTPEKIRLACPFQPDLIVGGPPCQGFSVAGPAWKDPKDPRSSLFRDFANWVNVLKPKAFIMENVKGLLSRRNSDNDRVVDIIKNTFGKLGFRTEIWSLNAANYGVPQLRERIFIVGHLGKTEIDRPAITHRLSTRSNGTESLSLFEDAQNIAPTLWDAISDLPELAAGQGGEQQLYNNPPLTAFQEWAREGSDLLFNHVAMDHSRRLVDRFEHIKWGESSSDVPTEHGARRRNGNGELSGSNYDQNNRRLHPLRPSHTIAASFYANFVHPFQHRNLTAREGARIQSFPDSYRFFGKKTVVSHKLLQREGRLDEKFLCQYNQIGNAVPPLLAKAIGYRMREKLK